MGYLVQLSMFDMTMDAGLINRMKGIFSGRITKVAYISSMTCEEREDYYDAIDTFSSFGEFEVDYYDFDKAYMKALKKDIFSYDVIYLSGGPTSKFRNDLDQYEVLRKLKTFYVNGGTIIGMSAGAIMMSSTIDVVKNWNNGDFSKVDTRAMNIVDYHFVPHWSNEREELMGLIHMSEEAQCTIYLCEDGSGLITDISKQQVEIYGPVKKIRDGVCV